MLFPVFLKGCCKDGNLFVSGWRMLVEIMVSYSGLFALRVDTSFAIAEMVWFSLAASGLILEWPGHRLLPYVVFLLVLAFSNLGLDSWSLFSQLFSAKLDCLLLPLDLLIRLRTSLVLFCLHLLCFDSLLISWQSRLPPFLILASNTSLGIDCFIFAPPCYRIRRKG